VTFNPGCAFSSSFLASLAQKTIPAVKLWVAAGIETPRLTFSSAIPAQAAQSTPTAVATTANLRMANFMVIGRTVTPAL
jgi:hypothetical protein